MCVLQSCNELPSGLSCMGAHQRMRTLLRDDIYKFKDDQEVLNEYEAKGLWEMLLR